MARYVYVCAEPKEYFENGRKNVLGAKKYAIQLIGEFGFYKVEIYNSTNENRKPLWIGTIWKRKDRFYTYETRAAGSTLLDRNGKKVKSNPYYGK